MSITKTLTKASVPPFILFTLILLILQLHGNLTEDNRVVDAIKYFLDTAYKEEGMDCVNVGFINEHGEFRDQILMQDKAAIIVLEEQENFAQGFKDLRRNYLEIVRVVKEFLDKEGTKLVCNYGPYGVEDVNPAFLSRMEFTQNSIELNYVIDGPNVEVSFALEGSSIFLNQMVLDYGNVKVFIDIVDGDSPIEQVAPNQFRISRKEFLVHDFSTELGNLGHQSLSIVRDLVGNYGRFNDLLGELNEHTNTNIALDNVKNLFQQ